MAWFAVPALGQLPTPAQTPVPRASGSHVPIALPMEAPPDWDPETWKNFRRRCQEVADMSARNQPMGSGDYGYADACTKEGAYFSPVKQRPPVPPRPATPMPTPGPGGHVPLDIPVNPPSESPYSREPQTWAMMRANCQKVADRLYYKQPVDREAAMDCGRMRMTVKAYSNPVSAPQPPLNSPSPTPTPVATPQEPSGNSQVGPFGTPFAAGSGDACTQGQPPDVAADVSPSQLAELLNQGIWVFNKQGQIQSGYPKSLAAFWASNSPPPANKLTDTQIAYEPIAQRWLASTLSIYPGLSNGDLYFAISNTSDATGAWTIYDFPSFCSAIDSSYPAPDQPILGYNQAWVVIDVSCFDQSQQPFIDNDQLLLIPHSAIATHPQNLGAIQEQGPTGTGSMGWFASRPSRDVSGTANQDLFLVSSAPLDSPGALDFVKVTSIDSNGNIVGPGPGNAIVQSPGIGVSATDTFSIAPGEHDNCGAGSGCVVSLGDARISSAPILQIGNDGNKYLLTAFHAGDNGNNTAQALFFMGQVNSFATSAKWNEWYFDGPNFWATYPTVTMDKDLDIAYSFTTFQLNSTIYPNWYTAKGFVPSGESYLSPPFTGYGILYSANSMGAYTGQQLCPTPQSPQRWGDYMSELWDPNLASPNESDAFWMVQEYTTGGSSQPNTGGSNQSTQFAPIQDPLPFFVGYQIPTGPNGELGEDEECPNNPACQLTFSPPTGALPGDTFVAVVAIGGSNNAANFSAPAGWTLMPLANHSNNQALVSSDPNSHFVTSYLATYIYGSQPNDPGQYTLSVTRSVKGAEMLGFMGVYRGASTNLSKYTAYGYLGVEDTTLIPTKQLVPAAGEQTLATIYGNTCLVETDENAEDTWTFGAPAGAPSETVESPLSSSGNGGLPFLLADVPVKTGGATYGPYTATGCKGLNYAYNLLIPE